MKKVFIFLFILVIIISSCTKSNNGNLEEDTITEEDINENGEEKCLFSPKLVQQYCTIRKPIKQNSGTLCNNVDTWWDRSEGSGSRRSLISFDTSTTTDENFDKARTFEKGLHGPDFDEAGVGDRAYIMPVSIDDSINQLENLRKGIKIKDSETATREDLEDIGFYLVVKKGDKRYSFTNRDAKDRGDNNFCNLEQMKALANSVIKGTQPKYEKPICYKEEKNELPNLVKKFCTVKTNLDKSVYCQVVDENYMEPLSISPWEYDPKIKELSTAGDFAEDLPFWDEPEIGDEAWTVPLRENKLTKEEATKDGFDLYVRKGDKVYQFHTINDNEDIKNEAEYIYTNCNLDQTKSIAKALLGGA